MSSDQKRFERMRTLDEEIAARIDTDLKTGLLAKTPGFGQPLKEDVGFDLTPSDWRMPMKILKDAGYAPPEVEMMNLRASLQSERADCHDELRVAEIDMQIQDLSLKISFLMDRFKP